MSKVIKKKVDGSHIVPRGTIESLVPVSKSKAEKPNGRAYTLQAPMKVKGQADLKVANRLVECIDGWYQPYTEEGHKLHYRLNPQVVGNIFGVGAVAKI